MKNIIIYEDNNIDKLSPFSINHASFETKCGIYNNLGRILHYYGANTNITLIVRDEIKGLISERYPSYNINPPEIPSGICINGAVVINKKYFDLSLSKNLKSNNNTISFILKNKLKLSDFNDHINKIDDFDIIDIPYISYLWDCIDLIPSILNYDMAHNVKKNKLKKYDDVVYINEDNIVIDNSSTIEPGSIIDAKNGPVIISKNVIVQSGSIIKGPVFIDKNSLISNGAKLKGNVLIGQTCKVGGEVTNTIFQGFSNKVHDGFIGHSYIGEWVNLGANTNNSNLKNNYSSIKFTFPNNTLDTKREFLGVMVGDYTRTGISTMINTGSYFGMGSNVFGSGFQNKFIDSFSWGKDAKVDFDKFINTLEIMKNRRSKKLSKIEFKFLEKIYSKIN
tara:strand:+ start:3297 stop:4475 length:1179 start_codon:yes stop_codon:yes gene_type:complete